MVKDLSQRLIPEQLNEIYLNEPHAPGMMNDLESAQTIEATRWNSLDREEDLTQFLTTGEPRFPVLLTHLAQSNCPNRYQRKTFFPCRRPEQVIVIPGY